MIFRPDAGRVLSREKLRLLRALTFKYWRLVDTRKRLLAQIKAHGKLGSADMFDAMASEFKDLLDRQISGLEVWIEQARASNERLATTVEILRSVPRIGPVTISILITEMPELAHLVRIAHDSGTMRAIGGGRHQLRHVMFQAALVASHHNPALKVFADHLRAAGKRHKFFIIAAVR